MELIKYHISVVFLIWVTFYAINTLVTLLDECEYRTSDNFLYLRLLYELALPTMQIVTDYVRKAF